MKTGFTEIFKAIVFFLIFNIQIKPNYIKDIMFEAQVKPFHDPKFRSNSSNFHSIKIPLAVVLTTFHINHRRILLELDNPDCMILSLVEIFM